MTRLAMHRRSVIPTPPPAGPAELLRVLGDLAAGVAQGHVVPLELEVSIHSVVAVLQIRGQSADEVAGLVRAAVERGGLADTGGVNDGAREVVAKSVAWCREAYHGESRHTRV